MRNSPIASGPSPQEAIERSRIGRLAIAVLIAFFITLIVIGNIPASRLRFELNKVADPVLFATGMEQRWGVFSPEPRRVSLKLEGRITYADGSTEIWRPPVNNDVFGAYRDYRWGKYMESLQSEDNDVLWRPTARWIVAHRAQRAVAPTSIQLVRQVHETPPPGPAAKKRTPYRDEVFFDASVEPNGELVER